MEIEIEMKLPNTAHTSLPWRIHEIVPDFRLEDVWALPTPGRADEFPILVEGFASSDPAKTLPRATRALWSLRWKLGDLFGLDDPGSGLGSRVTTLRERLPDDLCAPATGPAFERLPFTSLYLTDDEFAAEIANQTMHGVLHLGWVAEGTQRLPGPDGGLREAERHSGERLHGRDQAVPTPGRLPTDAPGDGAALAETTEP